MIVCWPSLFKIRLKHSVADLGEAPPPPTPHLLLILGKKKESQKEEKPVGHGTKNRRPPPLAQGLDPLLVLSILRSKSTCQESAWSL